ncbi:MAG: hypothetical protein ACTXOO_03560 [Sodalis sp. (in: enterobacteria)]
MPHVGNIEHALRRRIDLDSPCSAKLTESLISFSLSEYILSSQRRLPRSASRLTVSR